VINIGDLVKMSTAETGLIGIVVDKEPKGDGYCSPQIGIMWIGGENKVDWEPEPWLEVVSENK
jgi:hypothetical protein